MFHVSDRLPECFSHLTLQDAMTRDIFNQAENNIRTVLLWKIVTAANRHQTRGIAVTLNKLQRIAEDFQSFTKMLIYWNVSQMLLVRFEGGGDFLHQRHSLNIHCESETSRNTKTESRRWFIDETYLFYLEVVLCKIQISFRKM